MPIGDADVHLCTCHAARSLFFSCTTKWHTYWLLNAQLGLQKYMTWFRRALDVAIDFKCRGRRGGGVISQFQSSSPMLVFVSNQTLHFVGYKAYRNSVHGSRYVRSIVKVFSEHAKDEDVLSLLTKVQPTIIFIVGVATIYAAKYPLKFSSTVDNITWYTNNVRLSYEIAYLHYAA